MNRIFKITLPVLLIQFFVSYSFAQERILTWHQTNNVTNNYFPLTFDGAIDAQPYADLPVYFEQISLDTKSSTISYTLANTSYISLPTNLALPNEILEIIPNEPHIQVGIATARQQSYATIQFLPIRKNPQTGQIELLKQFTPVISIKQNTTTPLKQSTTIATQSVLSTGDWYKISVQESGIYKIGFADLQAYGINPENIDPRTISLHGFAGGMLPEKNQDLIYDDLPQITIQVVGEEDGIFNTDDYILFYGQSPNVWKIEASKQKMTHSTNLYNDYTYYYLTTGTQNPLRIGTQNQTALSPSHVVTTYHKGLIHELELQQMTKSGKKWYGETFNPETLQSFSFQFPDIDTAAKVNAELSVAGRSGLPNWFNLIHNSDTLLTISMVGMSGDQMGKLYARSDTESVQFKVKDHNINLSLSYNLPSSTSIGILDYLEVNAVCKLIFRQGQLPYSYMPRQSGGTIPEIFLAEAGSNVSIWNITDRMNVLRLATTFKNDGQSFKLQTASPLEFVAFDNTSFLTPVFVNKVVNQNLHALQPADYIIIAPEEFMAEAEELAQLHQSHSGLSTLVVPLKPIYEEFSSGAQDPVGIKAFIRMLYLRAEPGKEPRYVLLYGDGSYDPKNRIAGNTNVIPVFESQESLSFTDSYPCDDFYGLMDPEEGLDAAGAIDIGVGRLPVGTLQEAQAALLKIKQYLQSDSLTLGSWRNNICLLADDEDSNTHFDQAEDLAYIIDTAYVKFNEDKLYLDAFKQISTAAGYRYPDVNRLLADAINKGSLMINYTGHGGELGWAGESVLTIPEIYKWKNQSKYPVFVTATCEFSRFDDPGRVSAGEHVFLAPNKGGIALFTTTRLAYSHSNAFLNQSFYKTLFKPLNGDFPRLGDLVRLSKNLSNNSTKIKNFVLLGDPALNICFPKQEAVITTINGIAVANFSDTLKAFETVEMIGEIQNPAGTLNSSFNGTLEYRILDKNRVLRTLGNDPKSKPWPFKALGNTIATGQVAVNNGVFTFRFIIPKDIDYSYGPGKVSLYATDSLTDASGCFTDFVMGGMDPMAANDEKGPEIQVYLDDPRFESGNQTSCNPMMYIHLADSSGINYLGIGIGHDILATLDHDNAYAVNLNTRFNPSTISGNKKGSIVYPLSNLEVGNHNLTIKAWDLRNNSSETTIQFYASDFSSFNINQIINQPNPFKDKTWFMITHDMPGEEIKVQIDVFTIHGSKVKTLTASSYSAGYSVSPIEWDASSENGSKLPAGMYAYTVTLTNEKGVTSTQKQKLLILK